MFSDPMAKNYAKWVCMNENKDSPWSYDNVRITVKKIICELMDYHVLSPLPADDNTANNQQQTSIFFIDEHDQNTNISKTTTASRNVNELDFFEKFQQENFKS